MPGIVVFRRRWSVGSDDLVVPGAFLFTMHLIWTIVLCLLLAIIHFDRSIKCVEFLWGFVLGYLIVLVLSLAIELCICIVAMRGSILNTAPRSSMQYILYVKFVFMLIEGGWLAAGIVWLVNYYVDCPINRAKETALGLVICNWCVVVSVLITVWCTYDSAGRSWVKMKQYQRSMREAESKFNYKRSGSTRNWRQRKVLRAYQDSWQQRCRFLYCCASSSDRNRNSFADIARILSDFFRDLDVVPSDVIAGLVLLRKFQKIERRTIIQQHKNDTYEFLSGVAITPRTQFLSLHEGAELELFQTVIHYANYAVRAYGWPIYVTTTKMGLCHICPNLKCCCFPCKRSSSAEVVEDNCCQCNFAALQKLSDLGDIEFIYVTYHVDVGETPFSVALDYGRQKIVISIRGTLSIQDIVTDLNAEGETLPLNPPRDEWIGHKGMVQAAQYILEKLRSEELIERARDHCPERGTRDFKLVLVGHSLGAGTASILGILLKEEFKDLLCYCYSPPGGLLSMPAVEYTKSFTISVVIGKDVVPRIGLHQMETLRADLINAIKRSVDPKWKTISCSIICCGCLSQPTSAVEMLTTEGNVIEYMKSRDHARCVGAHPSDSSIALTSHQPLYPPGRIIHVVRHHPTRGEQALSKQGPVYQALWAQNTDFDEVLISPVMIQDHMPDQVLDALNKVITTLGPKKPERSLSNNNSSKNWDECELLFSQQSPNRTRLCLETSFTSLQSPSGAPSNASSITNGYYSTHSHPSPLQFGVLDERTTKLGARFPVCVQVNAPKFAKCLSLNLRSASLDSGKPLDLIHDDWFGLAPLASPESLSEVSSISSRTSFITNLDQIHPLSHSYELITPKVMRRTPKIMGNLSTCADDIRNVRNFQKLGQAGKFPRRYSNNGNSSITNSSSNLSYESATSNHDNENNWGVGLRCEGISEVTERGVDMINMSGESDDFQSAEDILDNVMISAGCADFFNSTTTFMETHFDEEIVSTPPPLQSTSRLLYQSSPQILSPSTPQDIDPDIISNFAIDLNLDEEHRSLQFSQRITDTSKPNSVDSGSCCRTPSDTKNVKFNPQVINIDSSYISRDTPETSPTKHKKSDRWHLLPLRYRHKGKSKSSRKITDSSSTTMSRVEQVPKTILCSKRHNSEDECFSRTEALPLLSGLSSANSEKTSPSFVRRKKYVYPTVTVLSKGESTV